MNHGHLLLFGKNFKLVSKTLIYLKLAVCQHWDANIRIYVNIAHCFELQFDTNASTQVGCLFQTL